MNETTDAAAIFAPLWRRAWLILLVGVVVAAGAYIHYKHKTPVYSVSTQLDLSSGAEAQQLVGGTAGGRSTLSSRTLADAAALVTSSDVGEAVRARLRREHRRAKNNGKVRAKAAAESDFVTITAEAASARQAARLANYYAQAYIERQRSAYRRQVRAAIANTRRQLRRIEAAQAAAASAAGARSSRHGSTGGRTAGAVSSSSVIQAASLASKINQLEGELSVSNIQQVDPAKPTGAQLVSPKPKENALFGFVLGVLIAGIAVFAVSRLGRRVHSLEQLEQIFKAPLLSVLPRVREPVLLRDGLPRPDSELLEPLRRVHTSLQLADTLGPDGNASPRLILCIGVDEGDGCSTLLADLALVQRDAGARVALIDADLRAPAQARLLGVNAPNGLVEVLAGAAPFDAVMRNVATNDAGARLDATQSPAGVSTLVRSSSTGSLALLAGGGPAVNPPALLAGQAMAELLRATAGEFDYVLVDAPSPLQVSDVMPLLRLVDGVVICARLERTRETSAARLAQLLSETATAPLLGVVANCAPPAAIRRYGFASAPAGRRWPARLNGR